MNNKILDQWCTEAYKQNRPLLASGNNVVKLKWSKPPRPQASFGLINDWVEVGAEVKGIYTKLIIPFQPKQLGWVKQESLQLFRFDPKKKSFEVIEYALVHPKHPVMYATIDRGGIYGLIGLNTHPLVQETIRLICRMRPILGTLPRKAQSAMRDRICNVILCARDMDKFGKSRDELIKLTDELGVDVPAKLPHSLPYLAEPGETLCDRCHGIDLEYFLDCEVLKPIPKNPCKQATWENVGPKHISGAMRQIVIDPTDHRRLYAVSTNGGIWCLNNVNNYPTEVWKPLTDGLEVSINLRFQTMAIAPSNGHILYAANSIKQLRGEPSEFFSEIYRSNTRGATWQSIHQSKMGVVHSIVVHPANPNVVFIATSTGLWHQSTTIGVWKNIFAADCLDVALDPDDSSIIYLGVRNQGIFKSFTSGLDWSANPILAFEPEKAGVGRQVIKIALGRFINNKKTSQTSTRRTVVVRFGNQINISRTSGEGSNAWQRVVPVIMGPNPNPPGPDVDRAPSFLEGGAAGRSDTNIRSEWCNCLAIDPFDPSHILVGSVFLLESTDGGQNWVQLGSNHEDEHSLAFDIESPGLVFRANDGGLFSSVDSGKTWPEMSLAHTNPRAGRGLNLAMGLVTSELRHSVVQSGRCFAAIDHTGFILSENFANRWQFLFNSSDNSARHTHESSFIFPCPASLDRYYIFNLRGGNRGDDPTKVTGRLAQFDFTRTNGQVAPPAFNFLSNRQASFPDSGELPGPFAARFSEARGERLLLFGTGTVGVPNMVFNIQSLLLGTNGTTVTASTIEATNTVEPFFALTFVPTDPDRAFAITKSGELFERDFSIPGQFTSVGRWNIPANELPTNELFVSRLIAVPRPTLNLYALSQQSIGRFDDNTQTWTTVQVWPNENEKLLALTAHPTREHTMFLGTNRGVYLSEDGGANWHPYRLGLPRIPIRELSFDQGYLYAATFGRGLWRCQPCPV